MSKKGGNVECKIERSKSSFIPKQNFSTIVGNTAMMKFDVTVNMVSLSEKRFSSVSNVDNSSEYSNEDSDYEYPNKLSSKKIVESKSKHRYSSQMTKQFQSNCASTQDARYRKSINNYDNRIKKQKCFSKNALMARENRLKKKLYLQNLEDSIEKYRDENKKLSSILDNQSTVIADLRKEVKYLKNVLANSTDIGRLLTSINQNIDMSVSAATNNKAKYQNSITAVTNTANDNLHPWAECKSLQADKFDQSDCSPIHGECPMFPLSDFEQDLKWNDLFSELHSSIPVDVEEMMWNVPDQEYLSNSCETSEEHIEHNYTTNLATDNIFEDAGVCLHIAKHRVSLELCSTCSENAATPRHEN